LKRIEAEELRPGMKLALPIRCPMSYKILLNAGTVLTAGQIERIKNLSPKEIFISTSKYSYHPAKMLFFEAVEALDKVYSDFFG